MAERITGAEITLESKVIATCLPMFSLVNWAQVAAPSLPSEDLKRKVISFWPDCGLKPPVIGEPVSIWEPVSRWPSTPCWPFNNGDASSTRLWPEVGSQATRGKAGLSAPASGSGSSLHTISAEAAASVVGSSDWRSALRTSSCFERNSAASMEFSGFAGSSAFKVMLDFSGCAGASPPA